MAPIAESRVYDTRLRDRRKITDAKYDDIFSSVVERISSEHEFEGLKEKIASDVWQHRRRTESGQSTSSSDDSKEHSLSPPSPSTELCCGSRGCQRIFATHMQLHRHISLEHDPADGGSCSKCGRASVVLNRLHVCRVCGQFAAQPEEHAKIHYRDRIGKSALFECRQCYKTFPAMNRVREHERRAHNMINTTRATTTKQVYCCNRCGQRFSSRHTRDTHFVSHFQNVIDVVWEAVQRMQEQYTDQTLVNQCPLCHSVMGSRKSFRLHVIHKHLMQDLDTILRLVSPPAVKQEVDTMRAEMALNDAMDKGYYIEVVKREPRMEDEEASPAPSSSAPSPPQVKEEPADYVETAVV